MGAACTNQSKPKFSEFGRILRVNRASLGLASMESRVPAWLTLMKPYTKLGTSPVSWWRYENGLSIPNMLCLIAMADMYGSRPEDVALSVDERHRARFNFIERLGRALVNDTARRAVEACATGSGDPASQQKRMRRRQPDRARNRVDSTRVLFPHFAATLAAARRRPGLTLQETRDRFPEWLDTAFPSSPEVSCEERVCPSTLWRYEQGLGLPNAVTLFLIMDAYAVRLEDLATACEADVAQLLEAFSISPSRMVHGSSTQ